MFYKNKIFLLLILLSFCFSSDSSLVNKNYITDQDGVVRMNVNIIGHVKLPGVYLLYDNIDLMSAIAAAGGFLEGANLKNIVIYKKGGGMYKVNLDKHIKHEKNSPLTKLMPYDTIYIEETLFSKLTRSSRFAINIP